MVVFLNKLNTLQPLSKEAIKKLDLEYGYHEQDNAETRNRFYQVALKTGPEYAEKAAGKFFSLEVI